MRTCAARRMSDQMVCPCGLKWDVNDPVPPHCPDEAGFKQLKPQAPDLLDAAAATFRERNAIYGNNYQRMGALLLALFPEGGVPAVRSEADANRLNLLIDCLGKLQRYAHGFSRGGHRDSAHDLIVYAAMLEEHTQNE